jgi:hypothetical protein
MSALRTAAVIFIPDPDDGTGVILACLLLINLISEKSTATGKGMIQ